MALTINKATPKDRPSLSGKQAEDESDGAVTEAFLKRDRAEAEQNGTPPEVPYYKFGYRTIRYRPSDIDAYIESRRVG